MELSSLVVLVVVLASGIVAWLEPWAAIAFVVNGSLLYYAGLDLFKGEVVRFPDRPGLKVPHMGWNHIHIRRRAPVLQDLADNTAFYFVHSYYVAPADPDIIATQTDYPTPFTSMIWRDNIFATQFHPEKSQRAGLQILHKFAALR